MDPKELIRELDRCLQENTPVALATVVEVSGSTPARKGAKMLIYPDGSIKGTIGGGSMEAAVIEEGKNSIEKGLSRFLEYKLNQEEAAGLGMVCGGNVSVFVEPWLAGPELIIVGAGHISQYLAPLAKMLDFQVVIIDDREEFACEENFPQADKIMVDDIGKSLAEYPVFAHHYLVIVTRGHQFDEIALEQVLSKDAAYLGMIGSRNKIEKIFNDLRDKGIPEEWLQKVYAPIGLDLGGNRPSEIALSIAAQLVEVRNRGA